MQEVRILSTAHGVGSGDDGTSSALGKTAQLARERASNC